MAESPTERIADAVLPDSVDTSRRLGPFSVGTWIVLGATGIAVGLAWRYLLPRFGRAAGGNSAEGSDEAPTVVDEQPDGLNGEGIWSQLPFPTTGSTFPATPGEYGDPPPPATERAPETNVEWARQGIDVLLVEGVSGTTAQQALSRYIYGLGIDSNQRALVDVVIRKLGPAPEPIAVQPIEETPLPDKPTPTPTPTPKPKPKPAPKPAPIDKPATVKKPAKKVAAPPVPKPAQLPKRTVQYGDTLWGMVRDHYGKVSTSLVRQVAAHNGLSWNAAGTVVSPWRVGQTVEFPSV